MMNLSGGGLRLERSNRSSFLSRSGSERACSSLNNHSGGIGNSGANTSSGICLDLGQILSTNLSDSGMGTRAVIANQADEIDRSGDMLERGVDEDFLGIGGGGNSGGGGGLGKSRSVKDGNSEACTARSKGYKGSDREFLYATAQTINRALQRDSKRPELESYVTQGVSWDYDLVGGEWTRFVKVQTYEIPDLVFDQYDHSQLSTHMGLFAEIQHVWVAIDNALYIWNYTLTNPELIGYEDQAYGITAVKLVVPRPGVFIDTITHLIVVATLCDIFLIGVACTEGENGVKNVALYQTKMRVSIKSLDITCIECSQKTGRIFFGGRTSNDVYELVYQKEERWFMAKCQKINRTSGGASSLLPYIPFLNKGEAEYVVQMVTDDSRDLLFTLSSRSSIRLFHMRTMNSLDLSISRDFTSIHNNIGHMVSRTPLLDCNTRIVSISAIHADEASRISLMATTSTGVRIFFSVRSSFPFSGDSIGAPSSMQVVHVRFPYPQAAASGSRRSHSRGSNSGVGKGYDEVVGSDSESLKTTRIAVRYAPGNFFCVVRRPFDEVDNLFTCAADCDRRESRMETNSNSGGAGGAKFVEVGSWIELDSTAIDIGQVKGPGMGTEDLGNEVALQFDEGITEIAVLTNTGVHTIRKKRLVDVFASVLRSKGEELELGIAKFIGLYGREEMAATALAVACGQAIDVGSETSINHITEAEVMEAAQMAFIQHGGRAVVKEDWDGNARRSSGANGGTNSSNNSGRSLSTIDNVRASARHDGLALYISRLVRSIWHARIITENQGGEESEQLAWGVPIDKIQSVQRNLVKVEELLRKKASKIEGLSGAEALTLATTKREELALQGEHRAMKGILRLIGRMIEGLSFVGALYEYRVEDILGGMKEGMIEGLLNLTYEAMICSEVGRVAGRELVKAMVELSIANGARVESVAEGLRRRCGTFCSSEDVVIFKGRELVNKAVEREVNWETGRIWLNQSLNMFLSVIEAMDFETVRETVRQYIEMRFFAGAVTLILQAASSIDRGNVALSWYREGARVDDPRKEKFDMRNEYYMLVRQVILAVDELMKYSDDNGERCLEQKRRGEMLQIIDDSGDELFQMSLLDWYLEENWVDKIMEVRNKFVVDYLKRRAREKREWGDLLWKYYEHWGDRIRSSEVQLWLAKHDFPVSLAERIEYLTRAKANVAMGFSGSGGSGDGRDLQREIGDLLELGVIQDELLRELSLDARLTRERRDAVIGELNGRILDISRLFNDYADQAGYYDICLIIYYTADYGNASDIMSTWRSLLGKIHDGEVERQVKDEKRVYEVISSRVVHLGRRMNLSETTFPVSRLMRLLYWYAMDTQSGRGMERHWVVNTFIEAGVSYDRIIEGLESIFVSNEAPCQGRTRRSLLASNIVYTVERWLRDPEAVASIARANLATLLREIAAASVLDAQQLDALNHVRVRLDTLAEPV